MRIGIFGGTFNPIHNGHLNLARQAKAKLALDKIILIPAYIPVHKAGYKLTGAQDRFNMASLAVEGIAGLEVSRYEIDKKGKSYSIDTVMHFKNSYPEGTDFFFLIGTDSLAELPVWKDIDRLSKLCKFVVFDRPGYPEDVKYEWVEKIDIEPISVSSTEIRERLKKNESISGLLPKAVKDYIIRKNLYN